MICKSWKYSIIVLMLITASSFAGTLLAPTVVQPSAKEVVQTSATLLSTVNPNGIATSVWFEYGTDVQYGSSSPFQSVAAGFGKVSVMAELGGLSPAKEYHYRMVALNDSGETFSPDNTFFTIIDGTIGQTLLPLTIKNNGGRVFALWIGVHPHATPCLDSIMGEKEIPPVSSARSFDARMVDYRPGSGCYGNGSFKDFRRFYSVSQLDTFEIRIQPGDGGYPVELSWPDCSSWFAGTLFLQFANSNPALIVDMRVGKSLTITDSLAQLMDNGRLVIVSGANTAALQPAVYPVTVKEPGQTSLEVCGNVIPYGSPANVWFHWESGADSGSTTPVLIASGCASVPILQTIDGLQPETQYRITMFAGNAFGISSGAPQFVTTVSFGGIGVNLFRFSVADTMRHVEGLWIGVRPHATACVDENLGEQVLPPKPSADQFDVRLVNTYTGPSCLGEGVHVDIRPLLNPAQVDTYRVDLQPAAGASPIVFTWDDVSGYFNGSVWLMDTYGGLAVRVNMAAQTSYTLRDSRIQSLYIITGLQGFGRGAPSDLTGAPGGVSADGATLNGYIDPHGYPTAAWFEWHAEKSFADSTWNATPEMEIFRVNDIFTATECLYDLQPDTKYTYHIVAQNIRGTMIGPEMTFHTGLTVTLAYGSGWNLASVPVNFDEGHVATFFPGVVIDGLSEMRDCYSSQSTLAARRGYWMKFSRDAAIQLDLPSVKAETVRVMPGWNLIGTIGNAVPVSVIGSIPQQLVVSKFYGYRPQCGYAGVATLEPGCGYWVKAQEAGYIVLPPTGETRTGAGIVINPGDEGPPPPPAVTAPVKPQVPMEFALYQNYPNPFNPATMLQFALPSDERVTLKVFDMLGREVAVLYDNVILAAGGYTVPFNAANLSSGLYMYRLQAGKFMESRKMVVMR